MKTQLRFKIVCLIFLLGLMSKVNAQVPRTIGSFSGQVSDFNVAEQIFGGQNVDYYVNYDDSYIYFAAFRTSGSTWWGTFDHFNVYFDTDPKSSVSSGGNGSTIGVNWDSNTPTLPFLADYRAAMRENNTSESFFSTYTTSWSTGPVNRKVWQQFADSDALEIRIPWSDLGNPDGLYFTMYCFFNGGFFGANDPSHPISISGSTVSGYFGGIGTKGKSYAPVDVSNQPITDIIETVTSNLSNAYPYAKVVSNSNETTTTDFTIASGGVLEMSSGVLTIGASNTGVFQDGAALDAAETGTFASGSTLQFDNEGIIGGLITIPNISIAGGVDFGTGSTIDGDLTIKTNGFVDTNPPTYLSFSTLIYSDNNRTYGRGLEWSATSAPVIPIMLLFRITQP